MEHTPGRRFHVGCAGFEHDAWRGSFYPADLPDEWRLAYYNQCFDCVWLPRGRWAAAPPAELGQWAEDTLERFRFVLGAGGEPPSDAERRRLGVLGMRLAGFDPPAPGDAPYTLLWLEPGTDLRALTARLRELAAGRSDVYLLATRPETAFMERLRTLLDLLELP